jgi:hypothetical protein
MGSIVWKALVAAFPLVGLWTMWRVGNGRSIRLGEDPWLGSKNDFRFSESLLQATHSADIFSLEDAKSQTPQPSWRQGWNSAENLGLDRADALE